MLGAALSMANRGPVVRPYLFAVYPILFLWTDNKEELALASSILDLLLPLAISVAITLFLLALS